MLDHGHAAQLADLPLGVPGTRIATARAVLPVVLLPGRVTATAATVTATVDTAAATGVMEATATTVAVNPHMVAPQPLREPLHGINHPPQAPLDTAVRTLATVLMVLPVLLVLLRDWAELLLGCLPRLPHRLVVLPLDFLAVSTR
jgi:hypothetical protein